MAKEQRQAFKFVNSSCSDALTLFEKYNLDKNPQFAQFVTSVFVCSRDEKGNSDLLKRFISLLQTLASGVRAADEFTCKKLVFEIAKYHNGLGGVDEFMRQFAKICLATDADLANKLERVLNMPISI